MRLLILIMRVKTQFNKGNNLVGRGGGGRRYEP